MLYIIIKIHELFLKIVFIEDIRASIPISVIHQLQIQLNKYYSYQNYEIPVWQVFPVNP